MKRKREWGIITAPMVIFAVFIFIPWLPTVQIIWTGASNIWLVFTFGWAISWYIGFTYWSKDYEKRKKQKDGN